MANDKDPKDRKPAAKSGGSHPIKNLGAHAGRLENLGAHAKPKKTS